MCHIVCYICLNRQILSVITYLIKLLLASPYLKPQHGIYDLLYLLATYLAKQTLNPSDTCFLLGKSRPFSYFRSFQTMRCRLKRIDCNGTRTRIVGVEGDHSDHLTTTTTHQVPLEIESLYSYCEKKFQCAPSKNRNHRFRFIKFYNIVME